MFQSRCKLVAVSVVLAGAGGAALLLSGGAAAGPRPPGKPLVIRVAGARDGIVVAVGTEVKKGEDVPAADRIEVKYLKEASVYRRLREGDAVEAGQMLAQIDDRLARQDLLFARAKLLAARAEHEAAQAVVKEAQVRVDRLDQLRRAGGAGAFSQEEYSAAVLVRDRYRADAIGKEAAIQLVQIEVERAQIVVDMHVIRSPVRGVVQRILKHPGEGVRALETVFEVRAAEPMK